MLITYEDAIRAILGPDVELEINGSGYDDINVINGTKPPLEKVIAKYNELILEATKEDKYKEVNRRYEELMNIITDKYPEKEMLTWDKQEAEARAYKKDPTTPTPLIDTLSYIRGIDKNILVDKIIKKADEYAKLVGTILGQKQKVEDLIEAAGKLDELNDIDIKSMIYIPSEAIE